MWTARASSFVFWPEGGRVLAGMNVNVWNLAEDIQRLLRSDKTVLAGGLADSQMTLGDLIF
jgi:hypothetical protein